MSEQKINIETIEQHAKRLETELADLHQKLAEAKAAPSDDDWTPKWYDNVWSVSGDGFFAPVFCGGYKIRHHNIFRTEAEAAKAAAMMKRSNAIIRACLLADPDYVPDWSNSDQQKWNVYYDYTRVCWYPVWRHNHNISVAYVSTKEKAEQVCALLTKWGIK